MRKKIILLIILILSYQTSVFSAKKTDTDSIDNTKMNVIEEPLISVEFEDMNLRDFVKKISELTNTNYILPHNLNGKVSITSPRKIPLSEIKKLLNMVLNQRNMATVKKGSFVEILPINQARNESIEIDTGTITKRKSEDVFTLIKQIKYCNLNEMVSIIKQLVSPGSRVIISNKTSSIIITGDLSTVEKVEKIIGEMDIDMVAPEIKFFKLKYADAADVISKVNNITSTLSSIRGIPNQVKLIFYEKNNSVIALATKDIMEFVVSLIEELDKDEKVNALIKVFNLKYIDVKETVKNLNVFLQSSYQSKSPAIRATKIIEDSRRKAIIVATPVHSVIDFVQDYLKRMDVSVELNRPIIKIFPLKNSDETNVAKYIEDIFKTQGDTYKDMLSKTKIIPDKRTGSIIVSTTYKKIIDDIKVMIKQLDSEVEVKKSNLHIYKCQHSNAKNLSEVLSKLTLTDPKSSEKRKAITSTFDESTNSVVVTASQEEYDQILKIIKDFDQPKPQVLINVWIAEINTELTKALGIEWQIGGKIGSSGSDYSGAVSQNLNMAAPYYTDSMGAKDVAKALTGLSVGIIKDDNTDIAAILNANKHNTNFNLLSNPTILTENNNEAVIDVGEKVPFITNKRVTDNNNSIYSYEYQMVGITLKITPHVNNSGIISLDIHQSVKDLLEQVLFDAPLVSNREIQTKVSVKEGNTIVIGGLIKNKGQKTEYAVPLLSKIPILGNLFKHTSNKKTKVNLLVVITPKIIRKAEELEVPPDKQKYFDDVLKESRRLFKEFEENRRK